MDDCGQAVAGHYARSGLGEAILEALRAAGRDPERLDPDDLAAVDEFHIRGREATEELAALAGFGPGDRVLDVGCGIGGASRLLARTCGCRVTGLDLTEEYCRTATMLAARAGLADRVGYRHGDALAMPFEDASFDGVWTQHVSMNIPDKPRLCAEMRRVLRPGGRAALYELVAAQVGAALHYPVPWARRAEISFVATEPELRAALAGAGFRIAQRRDVTQAGTEWFARMLERGRTAGPPPLGLHLLMGADFAPMAANVLRNLEEGRIRILQVIADAAD